MYTFTDENGKKLEIRTPAQLAIAYRKMLEEKLDQTVVVWTKVAGENGAINEEAITD